MGGKLKVFRWLGSYPRGIERPEGKAHRVQAQCVVAATSKAEAYRLCYGDETRGRGAWLKDTNETGNEHSIAAALSKPGTVFWQDDLNYAPGENVYREHPDYPREW